MKALILAWFVGLGLLALLLFKGFDYVYEKAYFNKQTKEKQTEILNWLNNDTLFIEQNEKGVFRNENDTTRSSSFGSDIPSNLLSILKEDNK